MPAGKIFKFKTQQTLRLLPAFRLVWQSSPRWTIARIVLLIIQGILKNLGPVKRIELECIKGMK